MVSIAPFSNASFCLDPGSSVLRTRTGCLYSGNAASKRLANAPTLLRTRELFVARIYDILRFASFAESISTPAFLYDNFLSLMPGECNLGRVILALSLQDIF